MNTYTLLAYAEHLRTPITLLVVPNTLSSTRVTAYHVAAFGAHLEVLLCAAHVAQPLAEGLKWAKEPGDLLLPALDGLVFLLHLFELGRHVRLHVLHSVPGSA